MSKPAQSAAWCAEKKNNSPYFSLMVKRIIAGILFVLGLVIVFFFKNYHGSFIPYPSLIFVGGFALVLTGAFLFYRTADNNIGALEKETSARRKRLKQRNEFITVDLSKCDILRNDYQQEVLQGTARSRAWDALVDETRNTRRETVHQSVLVYEAEVGGAPYKFSSQSLNIEYATLRFKLDAQKQTKWYVNHENPSEYYFDVEFLLANQQIN